MATGEHRCERCYARFENGHPTVCPGCGGRFFKVMGAQAPAPSPAPLPPVETPTSLESIGAVGVLDEHELGALNAGSRRVAALMGDGGWHTARAIRLAAGNGQEASEGLRRLRELRDLPGVEVVRRRAEGRAFEYRLRRTDGR